MSSKTQKKAKTSRVVHAALGTEPDYSVKFTDQVRALQRVIADALSAPVEHDDDMNYSSAQKLVVWLDRGCRPIAPRDPKSAYRLIDLVSSRGRFFTFITLGLSALTDWMEGKRCCETKATMGSARERKPAGRDQGPSAPHSVGNGIALLYSAG